MSTTTNIPPYRGEPEWNFEPYVRSATATRLRIDNMQGINLKKLRKVAAVIEKIRQRYGKPIIISSGYRCRALNKAIGGSPTSQHCKSEACDFHSLSDTRADNRELFNLVRSMIGNGEITVRQLINEHDYNWIHIGIVNGDGKRNQVFELK